MTILSLIIELDLKRYKYIVQVVIGEQRGEGVKYEQYTHTVLYCIYLFIVFIVLYCIYLFIVFIYCIVFIVRIGSRCLWDTDTDNYSQGLFINVHS